MSFYGMHKHAWLNPPGWRSSIEFALEQDDVQQALERLIEWASTCASYCEAHEPSSKGRWWRSWNYIQVAARAALLTRTTTPMPAGPEFSSQVPVEEGWYIFCGQRRVRIGQSTRPELVVVARDGDGKLVRVGRDFFYEAQNINGLWMRLELEALEDAAHQILMDAWASHVVSTLKEKRGIRSSTDMRYYLSWSFSTISDELAEQLICRAVALGLVEDLEETS